MNQRMVNFKIYIASSWKNQHAVEMLTAELRRLDIGVKVYSFVENNYGEQDAIDFDFFKWCWSDDGRRAFKYDTGNAMTADLVVYIAPSGTDAWAEVGAAYAKGVKIFGLWAKGEPSGIMRRMMDKWFTHYPELLAEVTKILNDIHIYAAQEFAKHGRI